MANPCHGLAALAFAAAAWSFNFGPLDISETDDFHNNEGLHGLATQYYYANYSVCDVEHRLMPGLWDEVRQLFHYVDQVPALALALGMVLYNYKWFVPRSTGVAEMDVDAIVIAADMFNRSIAFSRCIHDAPLTPPEFLQRGCHPKLPYATMINIKLGEEFARRREVRRALDHFNRASEVFRAMQAAPFFAGRSWLSIYDVNFNSDHYPATTHMSGPVWLASGDQKTGFPLAEFLESNFRVIQEELDTILSTDGLFDQLHFANINAEGQDHAPADGWRGIEIGEVSEDEPWKNATCAVAPHTCALLRTRLEITQCSTPTIAMFIRLKPGGWTKPHYGAGNRLACHLGLRVPQGPMLMTGGHGLRWAEGRAQVFDDTFMHEARTDPSFTGDRIILHVLFCHPCDPSQHQVYHGTPYEPQRLACDARVEQLPSEVTI